MQVKTVESTFMQHSTAILLIIQTFFDSKSKKTAKHLAE